MSRTLKRIAFLVLLFSSPGWAKAPKGIPTCRKTVGVVWIDEHNNQTQGLTAEQSKWFNGNMKKKYPGVCVEQSVPDYWLFIYTKGASYSGTRTVHTTKTSTVHATGTSTNTSTGDVSDVDVTGTVETPTTEQEWYYDYSKFYAAYVVHGSLPDGKANVIKTFLRVQDREHSESGGLLEALGNLNERHPDRGIIEDGLKFLSK